MENQEVNIDEIINKFNISVLKNIDKNNVIKIVNYLISEGVDYLDEIMENYIDLFLIDYNDFIKKFELLKIKYGKNLVYLISQDMNILEDMNN